MQTPPDYDPNPIKSSGKHFEVSAFDFHQKPAENIYIDMDS